jgi:beta-N-acetylhexosaminidase
MRQNRFMALTHAERLQAQHRYSRRRLFGWAGALVAGGIATAGATCSFANGFGSGRQQGGAEGGRNLFGGAAPSASPTPPALTREQRLGQLFMVGLSSSASADELAQTKDAISTYHAGNVVLYGTGWSSAQSVSTAIKPLQTLAGSANAGVQLFISGNQEGGQQGAFQAFYGTGFSAIPMPIAQAQGDPAKLEDEARVWGGQLLNAGVNLNLAPVLDTVPANMLATNDPIGHWGREYGSIPEDVITYGVAFERGMRAAKLAVSIKHFPGLGRVTGNTDFTAEGIVDDQFSGIDDPYVRPYKAGIDAGADFVMMSLALYPRVDSKPAVFSPVMIGDILRRGLGFQNIVITDDVGAAAAVADRTPGQRAVDFLRAGGDMILTVKPTDIQPMTAAVVQATANDAAFATQVNASVDRILRVKSNYGLLSPPSS